MLIEQTTSFKGYVKSFRCYPCEILIDPGLWRNQYKNDIVEILKLKALSIRIRLIICVSILFFKLQDEKSAYNGFYFCSFAERVLCAIFLPKAMCKAFEIIVAQIEVFIRYGNGWTINKANYIDLHIGKYDSISGGCGYINLARKILSKKCVLNVNCNDDLCFIYCVLSFVSLIIK